ncbi:MAG: transcription-repair coupling factor, partial [Actinomycetota bacterium]
MTPSPLLQVLGQSRPLQEALAKKSPIRSYVAPPGAQPIIISQLIETSQDPVAIIAASSKEADEIAAELLNLQPDIEVIDFPAWETLPHERLSPSPETVGRRLRALHRMHEIKQNGADHKVVIKLSIRAALQPVV